jgi:hypothetical protein
MSKYEKLVKILLIFLDRFRIYTQVEVGRVRREDVLRLRLDPEKEDENKKKVVFIFCTWWKESIVNACIIEATPHQAFSPSYDLAPSPSSPSAVSKLDQRHTGRPRKRDNLGESGRGREPNHTTAGKLGPLKYI